MAFLDFVHAHDGKPGSPPCGGARRSSVMNWSDGSSALTDSRWSGWWGILKARNIRGVLITPVT